MTNSLFSGTTIPVLEQVVNFSQARHGVLAGNIANLDTPGYRVRDLSPDVFQARLKQALAERDRPAGSRVGGTEYESLQQVTQNVEGMLRHDDSNVGIEQQVAEMAKNHMQHNLALA